MKDLYTELNVDPKSSAAEIAEALKRQPGLASAGTILINPKKRAVYDRSHSTLKTIGSLRYRLGLDTGQTWFLREHPDFAPSMFSDSQTKSTQKSVESPDSDKPAVEAPAGTESTKKSGFTFQRLTLTAFAVMGLVALFLILK